MILATAKELVSSITIITALEWDEREQFSTRSSSRLSSVLGFFSHFWHDISCQQIHETWSNEPNVSTLHVGDPQDVFFPARWMITVCQKQRPNCKAHSRVLTPWSRWFWVVVKGTSCGWLKMMWKCWEDRNSHEDHHPPRYRNCVMLCMILCT